MSFLESQYHSVDVRISSNPHFRQNIENETRSNFKRFLTADDALNNVKATQICQVTMTNSFYNVTEHSFFQYAFRTVTPHTITHYVHGTLNYVDQYDNFTFVKIPINPGFYSIYEMLDLIKSTNNNETVISSDGVLEKKYPEITSVSYDTLTQKAMIKFKFDTNEYCWNITGRSYYNAHFPNRKLTIAISIIGAYHPDSTTNVPNIDTSTGHAIQEGVITIFEGAPVLRPPYNVVNSPLSWNLGFHETKTHSVTKFDSASLNLTQESHKFIFGDTLVNLYPASIVNIHCPELADYRNFDCKNNSSSCIASFPITGEFGDVMSFRGNDFDSVIEYETPRPVTSLTMSLRDNNGKIINTNGCDWFAVIKLFYIL